jgi:hypothetical protein
MRKAPSSRPDGFDCLNLEPDIPRWHDTHSTKAKSLIDGVKAKELFFFDLIFMKPSVPPVSFDIRNHLRAPTRVRNRVTMIETQAGRHACA